jgi:excisionase family DNA binding protein
MENRYMTVNEVSELLRISKSKIYKMTMNSAIPHYKVGSKLLFKKQELIDFVESYIIPASPEKLNQFDLISPFSLAA